VEYNEPAIPNRVVADDNELQSITLGVYLPDGSSLISSRYKILDRSGRSATLTLNQWTGIMSIQIHEYDSVDHSMDDEADDLNLETRYADDARYGGEQ